MLALLGELGLLDDLFHDLLLLLLQVVLGLYLRHLHGLLGWDCGDLLLGPPALVGGVLDLHEGSVVADHLLGHLFELLGLLVDPLHLRNNYMVGLVVQNAVIPDELDVGQAPLDRLIHVVVQVAAHRAQVHGPLDHRGVVQQPEGDVVDRLPEVTGVLVVEQVLQQLLHLLLLLPAHHCITAEVTTTVHVDD